MVIKVSVVKQAMWWQWKRHEMADIRDAVIREEYLNGGERE